MVAWLPIVVVVEPFRDTTHLVEENEAAQSKCDDIVWPSADYLSCQPSHRARSDIPERAKNASKYSSTHSIMNQTFLIFFHIFLVLALVVIASAANDGTGAATSNAQQQGRGRGAGLVERMRQRHQRREDEMIANMQERRKGTRRAYQSGGGVGGMGRKTNQIVHKLSGPLKKRLEEMRNRRRAPEEL